MTAKRTPTEEAVETALAALEQATRQALAAVFADPGAELASALCLATELDSSWGEDIGYIHADVDRFLARKLPITSATKAALTVLYQAADTLMDAYLADAESED